MGVLVAACNAGRLRELFAAGVTVIEKRSEPGTGDLAAYDINSDSHAESFLRCLDGRFGAEFAELRSHPATRALEAYRGRAVPLALAADFIAAIARPLAACAAAMDQPVLTGLEALDATRAADGGWIVRARREGGAEVRLASRSLVLAAGAAQDEMRLRETTVAGVPLWPRYAGRLVLSRDVLSALRRELLRRSLAGAASPRVAIVGGSHSALAAATALLALRGIAWGSGAISILHRRPLRPMYLSPAAARAEGFDDFGADDVCPKTGRVFPLAGFRSDSRELLLRLMRLGGRLPEERVELVDLACNTTPTIEALFDRADLIVAATGYRPRALPLFDARGRRIALQGEGQGSLVDVASRVLDRAGRPVPGVFGIGLSAGYPLAGSHGEPSFRGEANGLSLWHAEIGEGIVAAVLDRAGRGRRRARARARASADSVALHA
jgi:hypothetical protein